MRPDTHRYIVAEWKVVLRMSKRFAEQPFDAIPFDGISDTARDGKTDSRVSEIVRPNIYHKRVGMFRKVGLIDREKLA